MNIAALIVSVGGLLVATWQLYRSRQAAEGASNAAKETKAALDAFKQMNNLLEMRDPYITGHSEEAAILSEKITRQMDLPEERVKRIKSAAHIHNIGKLGIPDKILLKSSKLTNEEWQKVKSHSAIGEDMVRGSGVHKEIADIIRHAHEYWDGRGYPDGLNGKDIPLGARIIAAADAYINMTTDRPYRKALTKEEAVEEIKRVKGTQLDPKVIEALVEIITKGEY